MKRIAYQGNLGSYSHITALRISESLPKGFESFAEVFEAVEKGEADLGLCTMSIFPSNKWLERIGALGHGRCCSRYCERK